MLSRFLWRLYLLWAGNGRAYDGLWQNEVAYILRRLAWRCGPAPWWDEETQRMYWINRETWRALKEER